MNEQIDIVIIGGGPAGLAAANRLANEKYTFAVFEAGLNLSGRHRSSPEHIASGVGGAGLYSDGKFSFFPSATSLWHLDDQDSLRKAYDWLDSSLRELGYSIPNFPSTISRKDADDGGEFRFKLYESIYVPLENRKQLIDELEKRSKGNLRAACRIISVQQKSNGFVLYADTPKGITCIGCKAVIFAGGRYGPRILTQLIPSLPTVFKRIELGIRLEQPEKDFIFNNNPSVDVKSITKGENNDEEWRTFCTCRNGEVIETIWDGTSTFSGRADGASSGFSNFGLNLRFTAPISDEKLVFEVHRTLTGNTTPFSVTGVEFLKSENVFFGPILDQKIRRKLRKLLSDKQLEATKIHGPCIEGFGRYPDLNNTLKVNSHDIWVAGDATGSFRGLTAALISGWYAAEQIEKYFRRSALMPAFVRESPTKPMTVIFTAQSKAFFYCRDAVCEFVLKQGLLPINPFRVFEYFLGDRVDRNMVRQGNNQLVELSDELWVFGPVADGVLFEIVRARERHKPVRFFSIATRSSEIKPVSVNDVTFEPEVHSRQITRPDLLALLSDTLSLRDHAISPQLKLAFEDLKHTQ